MPALTQLKEELIDITTMKSITSALTETSAGRIKKIRDQFERNVKIYYEISHIYHLVRISAFKMKIEEKIELPKLDLKTLSVAMTSNQRFYGAVNTNVMRTFINNAQQGKTELMVIGLTGQGYMQSSGFGKQFESVTFTKDIPNIEEAKSFIEKTQNFDSVIIYYPKFVSLVNQTIGTSDITQAKVSDEKENQEIKILFEPELPKILEFFNRQVRSLLFLRVMLETDLSLTAARLLSMSAAEERSDELVKEKKTEISRVTSSFINAQLLETFSSIKLWDNQEEF